MSEPSSAAEAAKEAAEREAQEVLSASPEAEIAAAEKAAAEAEANISEGVAVERDQYKEMAQRVQAEFENYRKRVQKQQVEMSERANERLVTELLPVLDTIDLALAHDPHGSLEQVRTALLGVLTKDGLERIDAAEKPFDPEIHEAVAHEPGEGSPVVAEDLRAGYRWKGRVIRPSMVKVTGA